MPRPRPRNYYYTPREPYTDAPPDPMTRPRVLPTAQQPQTSPQLNAFMAQQGRNALAPAGMAFDVGGSPRGMADIAPSLDPAERAYYGREDFNRDIADWQAWFDEQRMSEEEMMNRLRMYRDAPGTREAHEKAKRAVGRTRRADNAFARKQ